MAESKLYRARVQMVEAMEQGLRWDEAAKQADLQISQSAAYRLRQRMRQGGKQALQEGRHGHPAKLRGEVRAWLEETCRQAPYTPSHKIQAQLAEQFALSISVSQLNRVRATDGASAIQPNLRKKVSRSPREQKWQEGAGGLLLLAATHETDLLSQLEGAFPIKQPHATVQEPAPQHLLHPNVRLLLILLFLNAVGLHRLWDLRTYTGSELGRLSGRPQPYSYRHVERLLRSLAIANTDEAFTATLARWTSAVFQVKASSQEATSPQVYVDGLSLAVYTQTFIPRGLIGNSGKILGCRALVLLHDNQVHPLLATMHRGDLHLTDGIPSVLTRLVNRRPKWCT